MSALYPYSCSEECSWQPEEVSRHLSSLVVNSRGSSSAQSDSNSNSSHLLLSRGWTSTQVLSMRALFGLNAMQGDKADEGKKNLWGIIGPIMSSLYGQLKEPLILMLLGSAALSLFLGNTADAISIGIALFIVSLVAAIQEYRSETALEKLANLVPHTCTVLRDGRVLDRCLARELVLGDLVLLATGE